MEEAVNKHYSNSTRITEEPEVAAEEETEQPQEESPIEPETEETVDVTIPDEVNIPTDTEGDTINIETEAATEIPKNEVKKEKEEPYIPAWKKAFMRK